MVTYDEFNRFQAENTAQHAELNGKIDRLTEEVHGVDAEVRGLNTRVGAVEAEVHGLKTQVESLTERVHGVETQVAVLGERIEERTKGLQGAVDLTNRLLVVMLGMFGVTFAGFIASIFVR